MATAILLLNMASTLHGMSIATISVGLLGFIGPFAAVFLWGGMLRYWKLHDPSALWIRRIWFPVLTLGLFYGAIFYFVVIYAPTTYSYRAKLAESAQ